MQPCLNSLIGQRIIQLIIKIKLMKKLQINQKQRSKRIYFALMAALPLIQFAIMYVGVNFNSILLTFQEYDYALSGNGYVVTFAGFRNFAAAFDILLQKFYMVKISLIGFLVTMCISYPLAMIFSFYIYKKYALSGLFKTVLFLPQIISSLIFSTLFKYMVGSVYTEITGAEMGLLSNPDTTFTTVMFFNVWVSFGINVLMFSNAMGNIDHAVVESAHLDGVNVIQEFLHISIPGAWQTIVSCTIITLAGIFTNQLYLFDLFGEGGRFDIASIGFFLYQKASVADLVVTPGEPTLCVLSAMGVIFTIILVPMSMLLKKALTKFGPSED